MAQRTAVMNRRDTARQRCADETCKMRWFASPIATRKKATSFRRKLAAATQVFTSVDEIATLIRKFFTVFALENFSIVVIVEYTERRSAIPCVGNADDIRLLARNDVCIGVALPVLITQYVKRRYEPPISTMRTLQR